MPNDVSIIAGIIAFFIVCGVLIPIVNDAFGVTDQGIINVVEELYPNTTNPLPEYENQSNCKVFSHGGMSVLECDGVIIDNSVDGLSTGQYMASILGMFLWSFGVIPLYLELFLFVPLRILLGFLIYRAVRSGGG